MAGHILVIPSDGTFGEPLPPADDPVDMMDEDMLACRTGRLSPTLARGVIPAPVMDVSVEVDVPTTLLLSTSAKPTGTATVDPEPSPTLGPPRCTATP